MVAVTQSIVTIAAAASDEIETSKFQVKGQVWGQLGLIHGTYQENILNTRRYMLQQLVGLMCYKKGLYLVIK